MKDWQDYYKTLLNSFPEENRETDYNSEEFPLDIPFPCKEIKDGIKPLKKGKCGGPDLILNEFMKAGSNINYDFDQTF